MEIDDLRKLIRELAISIGKTYEPLFAAVKQVTDEYSESARKIGLEVAFIGEQISKSLAPLVVDTTWIEEAIPRLENSLQKYKLILIDLEFPPYYGFDFNQINSLVEVYEQKGKGEAKKYLNDLIGKEFNRNQINIMFANWKRSTYINKSRSKILDEIHFAHTSRKYFLSVATIIPQIEGVLIRGKKHKGRVNQKDILKLVKGLIDKGKFSIDKVLDIYFETILYTGFTLNKKRASSLSRNAILHGIDIKYGNRINSIKCMILFDYLLNKLDEQ
ncbi:hypothetical protein [Cohnella terricola]|uniref:Uncharacterized protein n=1 Tax=Cohnella terricola TaxID=1289167 RepID=A0A559JX52_9BACL|nr:hypothetical protein [Cohnella terricola]TVY04475.1 hypothetical protein FPZ45_02525 [Cohnella terricola]